MKGQAIHAYVTLQNRDSYSDELKKELSQVVRKQIGAFAAPEAIYWAPGGESLHPAAGGLSSLCLVWPSLCTWHAALQMWRNDGLRPALARLSGVKQKNKLKYKNSKPCLRQHR